MTQIIIAPSSLSGLSVTTGLSFGTGLILGYGAFSGIVFAGMGSLAASTLEVEHDTTVLAGAGNLSVFTIATTRNFANFRGAGSLLALGSVVDIIYQAAGGMVVSALLDEAGYGNLNGAGSLSAAVTLAEAGLALFAGSGGLSVVTRETEQEAATFRGNGALQATIFGATHASGIFSGTGGLSIPVFSLIFNSASSQYLTNTGNAATSTQKFTIAKWFKRGSTGATMGLYRAENALGSLFFFEVFFGADDRLNIVNSNGITANVQKVSNSTYTDTASWHHLCVAVDTTQAVADNRVRMYVDGAEVTSWDTNLNPAQNTNLNNNYPAQYLIGALSDAGTGIDNYFNGKLSEYYYIDGQQLTPSSFITGTPGVPQHYTGTYIGVFDFYLSFNNGASVTTLGQDYSGEGNNWTLTNMTTANQSPDYP